MQVNVLEATDNPDRLACRAARGDYYDGYIAEDSYDEVMDGVQYEARDLDVVREYADEWPRSQEYEELEAKTVALLRKTISRGHHGISEHPSITLAIEGVSRVVMSQITRHRHLSFDVQSMRYVDFSDVDFVEPPALAGLSEFSREDGEVDIEDREQLLREYRARVKQAVNYYEHMVEHGVPKEAARYILPLGTPVNITVSGNLRSLLHVLVLRDKADVQPETRQLARAISDELVEWAPYSTHVFQEAGPFRPSP
jgi:thymidylate synthase (FAD)